VVSLPFIFKSIPQMYELMDGAGGAALGEALEEKGIVALGYYDAGARSFYNSIQPINTPADVEGMKIRVMNNDLFVDMVNNLGGNGTPMAFAEVYQSIKNNTVDGAENNPPSYESTSHFEVAQFYSLTQHLIIPECLCMSKKAFDALTPEQQEIVKTAGKNSTDLQRKLWGEREAASMEIIKAGGVQVNEIADKSAFQAAMGPVYDGYLAANPDMTDLVNLFRNAD
jgi:tripartite ATP-independent transporter DctP family solute receptor